MKGMINIKTPASAPLLIIAASVWLLSGCATLSKQECTLGNWQAIGYNDGVAGHYANRLAAHTKACAKASVTPDYQAWERGRTLGLKQYCTTNNAYNLGRRGQAINSVCPADMVSQLRQAHQQGHAIYELTRQIDSDEQLLKKYRSDFDKLQDGEMLDFDNEKDARAYLLTLPTEFARIERRVKDNERQIRRLTQLNAY